MLNRHLPQEPLRPQPERRLTVGNMLAVALIAFVLSGGITYLLPGAAFEKNPPPAPDQYATTVRLDAGCTVELPHGKRRCAFGTIRGSVVRMEGY